MAGPVSYGTTLHNRRDVKNRYVPKIISGAQTLLATKAAAWSVMPILV
jgi:hypothetical protein